MNVKRWTVNLVALLAAAVAGQMYLPDNVAGSVAHAAKAAQTILLAMDSGQTGDHETDNAQLARYRGVVQSVHDGDTIRVRDEDGRVHKIRLAYIDAPELKQTSGQDSADALRNRIEGQHVRMVRFGLDRYQREVGQIWLADEDVNLWLVRQGWAWHYQSIARKEQAKPDYTRYQLAELQAKQHQLGLWQNQDAVAPWQFRRQMRQHAVHF